MDRELAHCNYIYLSRANNEISAFFMVVWSQLYINNQIHNELYYGLSGVAFQYRATKLALTTYLQAILHIASRPINYKAIGRFASAKTNVLGLVQKYWHIRQPDEDGLFEKNYFPLAEPIRQNYYAHRGYSRHPFILKSVATGTKDIYWDYQNFSSINLQQQITIFDELEVDECKGDRLLLLMDLLQPAKLHELKSILNQLLLSFNE